MATSHPAVVQVEQQYQLRRIIPVLLLGCAAIAAALGVNEQVSSKVSEIKLQTVLIDAGQVPVGGFAIHAPPVTTEQAADITTYQATITEAHDRRDTDWYAAALLLGTAVVSAASGSIMRAHEQRIPVITATTA